MRAGQKLCVRELPLPMSRRRDYSSAICEAAPRSARAPRRQSQARRRWAGQQPLGLLARGAGPHRVGPAHRQFLRGCNGRTAAPQPAPQFICTDHAHESIHHSFHAAAGVPLRQNSQTTRTAVAMNRLAILALCTLLAGCSQTSKPAGSGASPVSTTNTAAAATSRAAPAHQAASATGACDTAIRSQANSAMLGGALGMVGGFGGFGGRGGMVAAQVASTAGGAIARSQQAQAQANVMRECQSRQGY